MPITPDVLKASLATLHDEKLSAGELDASLHRVVDAACSVFAVDGAGVMMIDDGQSLHYVAATDGRSAALEAAQEESGEGPCIDSLMNDVVVHTSDLGNDPRWPKLVEAISGLGVRAVLGIPIHVGRTAVGSLNVYSEKTRPWDDDDQAALAAFATVIEEVMAHALVAQERHAIAEQLDHALAHRVIIERAVGVVMAQQHLDAVSAFNVLRTQARSERRKVASVAADTLAALTGDVAGV